MSLQGSSFRTREATTCPCLEQIFLLIHAQFEPVAKASPFDFPPAPSRHGSANGGDQVKQGILCLRARSTLITPVIEYMKNRLPATPQHRSLLPCDAHPGLEVANQWELEGAAHVGLPLPHTLTVIVAMDQAGWQEYLSAAVQIVTNTCRSRSGSAQSEILLNVDHHDQSS